MSALLWGLFVALATCLLLAFAVLITSLKFDLTLSSSPKWRLKIVARLLGGRTPPIVIHDSDCQRQTRKRLRPTRKMKRKAKISSDAAARIRRSVSAAPNLLADTLRQIHIEHLSVDADIGLGDPADTGQILGLFAPLVYSRRPSNVVSVVIRPDFTRLRVAGKVIARLSFVPLALVPPAARFTWHVFGRRL